MNLSDWGWLIVWFVSYSAYPVLWPPERRPRIRFIQHLDRVVGGSQIKSFVQKYACASLDLLSAALYQSHFWMQLAFLLFVVQDQRGFLHLWGLSSTIVLYAQFLFPTCPPWGESLTRIDHTTPGHPAFLVRVDRLLGIRWFENLFKNNRVVFACFPSMHTAWAFQTALFAWIEYTCPWVYTSYFLLLSMATVYLNHHYVIDCLGGVLYTALFWILLK